MTEIPDKSNTAKAGHRRVHMANERTFLMGEVIPGQSTIGGGSLPGETLPTWLLALRIHKPDRFLARLRQPHPPIIARLEADQIVFDPRTILPEQELTFIDNVRAAQAI